MLKPLLACVATLSACMTSAAAQEGERAQAAFNVFRNVCLSGADNVALTEMLAGDGWVQTTPDALPRTARRSNVQIADQSPPGALVFEYPDQPSWLFVQLDPRKTHGEFWPCSVYAVGVSSTDIAGMLYPNAEDSRRRESFVAMPAAFGGVGVKPYVISAARIALDDEHAAQRTFAFFALTTERAD